MYNIYWSAITLKPHKHFPHDPKTALVQGWIPQDFWRCPVVKRHQDISSTSSTFCKLWDMVSMDSTCFFPARLTDTQSDWWEIWRSSQNLDLNLFRNGFSNMMVSASVAKWKKPLPFRNVIARASHCFRRLVLLIVYPGAISFPGKQRTHTLLSIWHKRWSDESGFLWHLYCPVLTLTCPLRELSVADRHLHTQGHLTRPAVLEVLWPSGLPIFPALKTSTWRTDCSFAAKYPHCHKIIYGIYFTCQWF